MIVPPVNTVRPNPKSEKRRPSQPRVPVLATPVEDSTLPVSILPAAVVAAMNAVPPGFSLNMELVAQLVLEHTPLANAVLSLWSYLLQPAALDAIFAKHRGRSFEKVLEFSTFVELIRDALVLHKGSGRASFAAAKKQGNLPTTYEAVYGKLERIPISLSLGFFEDATERVREILPVTTRSKPLPASLDGMTVTIVDGKQIKKVAKRLKLLRPKAGKVVGGKLLVAYLPFEGIAAAMAADLDGEANDIRLMPDLIPRARARIRGVRLWVLDRQFCDLTQPALLSEEGDHFLIRRSLKTHFHPDPQRPAQTTTDERSRKVVEEWGWLGSEKDKRRRYVRQIRLIRPGEDDIFLVTDLLDGDRYPASDLLEVYLTRWHIETVFQQITEIYELRRLIGSRPEATIFQAAFCLTLYNMMQVVRAYVAAGQTELPVDHVSVEMIFRDVQKHLTTLMVLYPAKTIASWFAENLTHEQVIARLTHVLGAAWTPEYRKSVNEKQRPKVKKAKGSGAHTSVQKVLEADRKQRTTTKGSP
jgi:hypothetical protein